MEFHKEKSLTLFWYNTLELRYAHFKFNFGHFPLTPMHYAIAPLLIWVFAYALEIIMQFCLGQNCEINFKFYIKSWLSHDRRDEIERNFQRRSMIISTSYANNENSKRANSNRSNWTFKFWPMLVDLPATQVSDEKISEFIRCAMFILTI